VIRFGKQEAISEVVYKTLTPVWDVHKNSFMLDVTEPHHLEIHMWDRDRGTADDYMGYVCLPPSEYLKATSKCKLWLPLLKPAKKRRKKKDRGSILISIQYLDYTALLNRIISSESDIIPRVCVRTVKNDLAHAVVALYLCKRIALPLIKTLIQQEVERTSDPNTLFRTNSMATKCMLEFAHLTGSIYLKKTLQEPVETILQNPVSIEVDPHKLTPEELDQVNTNMNVLKNSVSMFLRSIVSSSRSCPAPIREVCKYLYDTVHAKFPDYAIRLVGGFIVLRFLCPAVAAPENHGLAASAADVLPASRRHLILVSKVLQNIANGCVLMKEECMQAINPFIESQNSTVQSFFVALTETSCSEKSLLMVPDPPLDEQIRHLDLINSYLCDSLPDIIEEDLAAGVADDELKAKKELFALLNLKYQTGDVRKPTADVAYIAHLHRKRYFTEETLRGSETNTLSLP